MMFVLSAKTLAGLRTEARAAAPAECCGLLAGHVTAGRIFVSSTHAVPNDDRDRYHIPPATFVDVERAARAEGHGVCGVYHSHPLGAALPSEIDRGAAWPGLVYLIIAGDDARAWRLTDERGFAEVPIVLHDGDGTGAPESRLQPLPHRPVPA